MISAPKLICEHATTVLGEKNDQLLRGLAQAIGETFRDLLPVWADIWNNADVSY